MAAATFAKSFEKIWKNTDIGGGAKIDLDDTTAGVYKMILLTAQTNWTPSSSGDEFVDSGSGQGPISDEISCTGYTTGGVALTSVSVGRTGDTISFQSANVAFGALESGATIERVLIYRDLGGLDTANPILYYSDVASTATNGSTVTINMPSGGWFTDS